MDKSLLGNSLCDRIITGHASLLTSTCLKDNSWSPFSSISALGRANFVGPSKE